MEKEIIDINKTTLRKVNQSDINFLFNLRNQEDVYKYFKNPKKVEYEEHIDWITPIINQERQEIYL